MRKGRKLFYYSDEDVSYREASWFRLKFGFGVVGTAFFLVACVFVANRYFGDILGIDYNRLSFLSTENQLLKEQVRTLNGKLADISATIDRLAERDNQLRVAVNLPTVDTEVKAMGAGGASRELALGLVSTDAYDLLTSSRDLMEKLERELSFQQQSYEDVYKKSLLNKELFARIPAIKPMKGIFSYHGFGMRVHPILGIYRMHEGVDIANEIGTPVYATGNGVVEFAGGTGSNYGVAVEINHGFGYKSWYAHLWKPIVRPGQKVKRGDLIAYSGNSGLSNGPHLHYEVRLNGEKKNPVVYFIDDVDYEQIRNQLAASER